MPQFLGFSGQSRDQSALGIRFAISPLALDSPALRPVCDDGPTNRGALAMAIAAGAGTFAAVGQWKEDN